MFPVPSSFRALRTPSGGTLLLPAASVPYAPTAADLAAWERIYARCIDDLLWPEFAPEELRRLWFLAWLRPVLLYEEWMGAPPEPARGGARFVPVD